MPSKLNINGSELAQFMNLGMRLIENYKKSDLNNSIGNNTVFDINQPQQYYEYIPTDY